MQQICLLRRNDDDENDSTYAKSTEVEIMTRTAMLTATVRVIEAVCVERKKKSNRKSRSAMYTSSSWLNAARAVINYTSF